MLSIQGQAGSRRRRHGYLAGPQLSQENQKQGQYMAPLLQLVLRRRGVIIMLTVELDWESAIGVKDKITIILRVVK